MAYLRKGVTWIPEYTLRILDEDTAELTLRGTLVNEAEDIIHGDVHFVVGVPSFAHTDYLAPVVVGQMLGHAEDGAVVASAGVRPGDRIVQVGPAPVEGAALLAGEPIASATSKELRARAS